MRSGPCFHWICQWKNCMLDAVRAVCPMGASLLMLLLKCGTTIKSHPSLDPSQFPCTYLYVAVRHEMCSCHIWLYWAQYQNFCLNRPMSYQEPALHSSHVHLWLCDVHIRIMEAKEGKERLFSSHSNVGSILLSHNIKKLKTGCLDLIPGSTTY